MAGQSIDTVVTTSLRFGLSSLKFAWLGWVSLTDHERVGHMESDAWQQVAQMITNRLLEMGRWGNLSRIARESDVSVVTWGNLLEATRPVTRVDKRVAVCAYLGWTHDSIDRILAGGEPELRQAIADELRAAGLTVRTPTPPADSLAAMAVRLEQVEAVVAELQELVAAERAEQDGIAPPASRQAGP